MPQIHPDKPVNIDIPKALLSVTSLIIQEEKNADNTLPEIIEHRIKKFKNFYYFNIITTIIISISLTIAGIAGIYELHYSDEANSAILITGCACFIFSGIIISPIRIRSQRKSYFEQVNLLKDPLIVWKLDANTWKQYIEYLHHDPSTKVHYFLPLGQRCSCTGCKCQKSYAEAIERNGGYLLLYDHCLMIDNIYYLNFPVHYAPVTILSQKNDRKIIRVTINADKRYLDLMAPNEMESDTLSDTIDEVNVKIKHKLEQKLKAKRTGCCCSREIGLDTLDLILGLFSEIAPTVA